MILNGYTILSLFLCILRLMLSVVIVATGWSSWRLARRISQLDEREAVESRSYLLFLSAIVLMGINVASWPVFYALLQSYVREWPAAMCIYGVTQIGAGTQGISRFLPGLLTSLQWTKPLLLFLCGAGFVLYLINRRTRSAAIQQRVIIALLFIGLGTMFDSAVEAAYLVIPKKEIHLAGGCCTNPLDEIQQAEKFIPRLQLDERQRPRLAGAYYLLNLSLIATLFGVTVGVSRESIRTWRWPLLLIASAALPLSLWYLVEIAAPTILRLPFHRCAYDLITVAPESMLAVAFYLLSCCCVGWACLAAQVGRCEQTAPFLPDYLRRLLWLALFGYAASLIIVAMEMLLA